MAADKPRPLLQNSLVHAITRNGNYANLLKSILEKFVKAHQVNIFLAGFIHLKPVWLVGRLAQEEQRVY